MYQNFCLFHVSKLSVLNFRFFSPHVSGVSDDPRLMTETASTDGVTQPDQSYGSGDSGQGDVTARNMYVCAPRGNARTERWLASLPGLAAGYNIGAAQDTLRDSKLCRHREHSRKASGLDVMNTGASCNWLRTTVA